MTVENFHKGLALISFSRTSHYRRAFIEKLRWVVAARLGPDFDFEVELREPHSTHTIDALVRATYMAHELVDERETMKVPAGPWNTIKDGLNQLLDAFEIACRKRSIEPIDFRFKVTTRPVVIKRVYHACPHLSKEHKGHDSWIFAGPAEHRLNFRVAHQISSLVEQGLREPQMASSMLLLIQQRLRFTGAFE